MTISQGFSFCYQPAQNDLSCLQLFFSKPLPDLICTNEASFKEFCLSLCEDIIIFVAKSCLRFLRFIQRDLLKKKQKTQTAQPTKKCLMYELYQPSKS